MENITLAERNKMALKYGLIVGVIYCVLFSVINLLVGNFIVYNITRVISYILYMVLMGVFASQIKRANGGFIEFKEVFGAVFVMLLSAGVLYFIYSYIYILYINPQFMDKMKGSVLTFMENMKTPDDKIEKAMQDFDKRIEESKKFNIGSSLQSFFGFLVMDSLFGMVVCLIVKKSKPVF